MPQSMGSPRIGHNLVIEKQQNSLGFKMALPAIAGDGGSISGLGRSPGGGNGNHSSILAWEIPWTEEPGGLESMGLQRVGHDSAQIFCERGVPWGP